MKKIPTLKGFADWLPEQAVIREKTVAILKDTFSFFGFQPLETPSLEYASVLTGKYGDEADKLIYLFEDRGKRQVGLRYDLTLPTSRVLALYQNKITFPFKRYQIQNVFRAEKPQRGRLREFTQCDFDIFGTSSPLADGEILLVIWNSLKNLRFKNFLILINSRKILEKILEEAQISPQKRKSVLQTIDKLDKQPKQAVEKELSKKGLNLKQIKKIFSLLEKTSPDEEIKEIFSFLKKNKIPRQYWQFSSSLVRGLDYYTGPIFEVKIVKPKIGSICGGGRYDQLISLLGGPEIPATGASFGLERIFETIQEENLWPEWTPLRTKVLVTIFSPQYKDVSISWTSALRKQGISCELYLDEKKKLSKQIKYADKKKIPWVIIIGPDEEKEKKALLKEMASGKQEKLTLKEIVQKINGGKIK